jgi:hypothetical protein
MTNAIDVPGWVRVFWLVVVFIIGGIGIGCVWWPASEELSQRHAHAMELYDEANTFDAATRRASQLRSAQERIAEDLSELGGLRSPGAVTAAVLRLLHEDSKNESVQIREVAPDAAIRSAVGTTEKAHQEDLLSGSDVAISVRGPFRNVIALVADLPRHDVLIDIHDIQITSTGALRKPPVLDVTLHSTIYRLVALPTMENSRVRTFR